MDLTSIRFFCFIVVVAIIFYSIQSLQKYILLFASLYFYVRISSIGIFRLCLLIIYIGVLTYGSALLIDRTDGRLKETVLSISIIGIVSPLVLFKYAFNISSVIAELFRFSSDFSWLKFGAVIGISYYALSAIGYLVDVFWGNCKAEKNIAEVLLFIYYFPQLISGPVTRFFHMSAQFSRRKSLNYENITGGMRRMAWGYFKKLVISERFAIVVSTVYGNYCDYSLIGIVLATMCYAIQLYTDFSGCMDIIMGTSMLFGIELPENFKAPFFAESIQEFWRRWHITLGIWFKDYLMYPLQKSRRMQKIGKWFKIKLGKKAGKKIPFYISMIILWTLIGIWHGGTGYYFIASAMVPCVLLIISDMCQPLFKKIVNALKINTECESWKWIKRIRTLLLVCVCWMVVCSNGTYNAINLFKHAFANPVKFTPYTSALEIFGLNTLDITIMGTGVVILYLADLCVYKGTTVFERMDKQNFWIRILLIYSELLVTILYGVIGSSSFIYFKF